MTRWNGSGPLALVTALALITTACESPQALPQDDLLAAAPNMTADGLLDGLELDPGQEAEIRHKVESLHDAMLEAHELHGDGELTEADQEAMHAKLVDVHARHDDLMAAMTPEQQQAFFDNAHKLMAEHGDEDHAARAHEKMQLHEKHPSHEANHDGDHGH